MVRADPPDALDSSSYDLTSTRTYTKGLPKQALGVVMIMVAFILGLGLFRIVRGPLANIPVVGSLMSAGDQQSGLPGVNRVTG